jgi:dolichol-phosphate mannosyltransferase
MRNKLSVVVSVYNEELSLRQFWETASDVLNHCDIDYEVIFVNDGSADQSEQILYELANQNSQVKVVSFARNFGHEAAMIAGIDYASGDYIVCMDADLQHPPASIPAILQKFYEGYDVVSMIRTENADAGFFKRLTSSTFYKVLNLFSPVKFENNSSDFFAISRQVADVLRHDYREKVRYLRGYVQSVGFRRTTLEFKAASRVAGESKYNFRKLLNFSIHTLCSFSDFPLKLGLYTGTFVAVLGIILMFYGIYQRIFHNTPGGYFAIIVALCFLFSLTLIVIGIIGEYISILFAEIKNRPIYIVKETQNLYENQEDESVAKNQTQY